MKRTTRTLLLTSALTKSALFAFACGSITAPTGPETEVVDLFRADGIAFTAGAAVVAGDSLEVTLTATNETDFDATTGILGGACMLRPRLYTERGGLLAWSAFDLHEACPDPLRLFQLGGGGSATETERFHVDVEDGDYFVTLTIEALQLVELAAGTVSYR